MLRHQYRVRDTICASLRALPLSALCYDLLWLSITYAARYEGVRLSAKLALQRRESGNGREERITLSLPLSYTYYVALVLLAPMLSAVFRLLIRAMSCCLYAYITPYVYSCFSAFTDCL